MVADVHALYGVIFKLWREKRFRLFLNSIAPKATDTLLDVGGYPKNWIDRPQPVARIDTVNVDPVDWDPQSAPGHTIRALCGDGCALDAPDHSYDIAFSNSVIEHVGTWERQQQFAAEIRRVGKAIWVQTPAYECPIEPHVLGLFIHYLPRTWQKRSVRWFTLRGWIDHPSRAQVDDIIDSMRLLRKSEMAKLFPDCRILTERMFGVIPKSYIAYRAG